jgi:hypothetical protein
VQPGWRYLSLQGLLNLIAQQTLLILLVLLSYELTQLPIKLLRYPNLQLNLKQACFKLLNL